MSCADAMQIGMAERNVDAGDAPDITFRVGINLGDVVIDGDDLYGEGVNIAARLEALAQPGTTYICSKVYEEVRNKSPLSFHDGRVRITAQLVDAPTGRHVWAERYDRESEDIFDLQDEMTRTIIGAVEPEISAAQRERALTKAPDSLDAWETY